MAIVESVTNAATTAVTNAANVLTSSSFIPKESAAASSQGVTDTKIPNPLHDYASYNYLFSLAILDDVDLNEARYKTHGAKGPFLARSANRSPNDRVVISAGSFDFFIEDLTINHLTGWEKSTQNTNALGFSFKIIEPYSMGLFFQALQTDAIAKGYQNYAVVPMLLTIEFKGHKNPNEQMISIDRTTRHYPIKFLEMDMKVTKQGCVYDIKAQVTNDAAFENAIVTLLTDTSISGNTVEKMLKTHETKSLELYLNGRVKEQVKSNLLPIADEYVIDFPALPDGTANPIGVSSMGFSFYNSGNSPFAKDNLVYENGVYKRGTLTIDPTESEFRFTAGSDIVNAINQVVLMSDYGRSALSKVPEDGMIKWWRVETRVEHITADPTKLTNGTKPIRYIYRVLPYDVDVSPVLAANDKRPGTEELAKQIVKEYNYIYTGKNIDILDFDITFKNGFYTSVSPSGNQNAGDVVTSEQQSLDTTPNAHNANREFNQFQPGQSEIGLGAVPQIQRPTKMSNVSSNQGGGGLDDATSLAAKHFQTVITAGDDMVTLDVTILGDPYYMGDSGVGNYTAAPGESKFINADGAISWDTAQPHVVINFLTPTDINQATGMYDFSSASKVPQLSGIYRVHQVTSNFSRGKFTQELKMFRVANQNAAQGSGSLAVSPKPTLLGALAGATDVLDEFGNFIDNTVVSGASEILDEFGNIIKIADNALDGITDAAGELLGGIGDIVDAAGDAVNNAVKEVGNVFDKLPSKLPPL